MSSIADCPVRMADNPRSKIRNPQFDCAFTRRSWRFIILRAVSGLSSDRRCQARWNRSLTDTDRRSLAGDAAAIAADVSTAELQEGLQDRREIIALQVSDAELPPRVQSANRRSSQHAYC